jgi:hypothetical protein
MAFPDASDDINNGVPSAGYQTALSNWLAVYLTAVTVPNAGATGSVSLVPCLNHRPGKTPLPATVTDITSGSISAFWATQRRRGSFGRANSVPF